ncbi:MAG: hypothetical protein D6693_02370 [Planctomycetota bacterium]|nr:MAG: hypothetical protein D6693_02370 [Planctomycetota bacterium]
MSGTDVAGLRRAVLDLTQTQRRVLILHYAEGLAPREVAHVLELGEARVEAILEGLRAWAAARLGVAERPDQASAAGPLAAARTPA